MNNLLTDQHITAEALMILENELVFTKQVNRQYEKEFKGPAKRGATVFAKKPPKYTVRDGQNVAIQDTTITQVPVTLNHQFGVDVEFTSSDLALDIEAFGRDVLQPQIVQIANAIDLAGLQMAALASGNVVGVAGTSPGTGATAQAALAIYGNAAALLDSNACPRDTRRAVVFDEYAQAATVPALAGLLSPTNDIADQYRNGQIGRALGFKFGMSQNTAAFTTGAFGGTPQVATQPTPQSGPSGTTLSTSTGTFAVATKGWTSSAVIGNAGDVVYFATCYLVNPVGKQQKKGLKGFVLAQTATADGSGLCTLQLTEPMITTGAWQNVSNVPAVNAAITFAGPASTVSTQNLAFHQDAITLACVDLPLPAGVHMAARKSDSQLNISMRFIAAYNISTDQFIGRFDVLCGWAVLRPEWVTRILG